MEFKEVLELIVVAANVAVGATAIWKTIRDDKRAEQRRRDAQ